MKSLTTTLSGFVVQQPLAAALPGPARFGAVLRHSLSRVAQAMRVTDHETARNAYLAGASDPADLECREGAWERAWAAYRTLPPAL